MNLSRGQQLAVAQLERIQHTGPQLLRVTDIKEGPIPGWAEVTVSLSTRGIVTAPDGFPLRARERFIFHLAPDFPWRLPEARVAHTRWAGRPHVQWGTYLCLYLAPGSQWHPPDGMFGLIERLLHWLTQAAVNDLDPTGVPVHPPVAYRFNPDAPSVIIRADTPEPTLRLLFGKAVEHGAHRLDIVELDRRAPDASEGPATVVAFTPKRLEVFEFPLLVGSLLAALETLGLPMEFIRERLLEAAAAAPSGSPTLVVLGEDTRELDDDGTTVTDHFMAWHLAPDISDHLRTLASATPAADNAETHEALDAVSDWLDELADYCYVEDIRPQVTQRRDDGTPAAAFADTVVEIWGCGALGGWLAEYVIRANPRHLILRDRAQVRPGVLVRQPYGEGDLLSNKAMALAERLRRLVPNADITPRPCDVISDTPSERLPEADVVIDATASRLVAAHIEAALSAQLADAPDEPHPVVASVMTDAHAERLLLLASGSWYTGGPSDIARRAQIALRGRTRARHFLDAFWGEPALADLFRPEPGCSDATFHGSAADAAALAGEALSLLGAELPDLLTGSHAASRFVLRPYVDTEPPQRRRLRLAFEPDTLLVDSDSGYQVRLACEAKTVIRSVARSSIVQAPGSQPETGGLLFGERDDAARVVWVSAATPPPRDSTASNTEFICGTAGNTDLNQQLRQASGHAIYYVGMWHTHPNQSASPSERDKATMEAQVRRGAGLVFIIAGGPLEDPNFAAYVAGLTGEVAPGDTFATTSAVTADPVHPLTSQQRAAWTADSPRSAAAAETRDRAGSPLATPAVGTGIERPTPCTAPMPDRARLDPLPAGLRPLGLALSGGGFRATLAALGSLRLLADAGLLSRVRIVSSVSGGSIANGLLALAYAQLREENFTLEALDRLVVRPAIEAITQSSLTAALFRNLWRAGRPGRTRTHVLEHCLDRRLFEGTHLRDLPTGCWFMFNAANEATGARFRFDRDVAGDYVIGSLAVQDSHLRVATAVAASAAVPGPFPPMELRGYEFACGTEARLIDGGAYDNLGLEPFNRRPEYFLVALNAGGLFHTNRRGLRIPLVGNLRRANALLYRQVSALRSRWLIERFAEVADDLDTERSGALVDLAARFDNLTGDSRTQFEEWCDTSPKPSDQVRTELAAAPTTFGRVDRDRAVGLVRLGWWTTGATLAAHHRELLPDRLPGWKPFSR